MKPGKEVTIYEDPLTRMEPEMQAVLVERLHSLGEYNGSTIGYWVVEYEEDGTKQRIERQILEVDAGE